MTAERPAHWTPPNADCVRRALSLAGATQQQAADALGVTRRAISNWCSESSGRSPDWPHWFTLLAWARERVQARVDAAAEPLGELRDLL